MEKSLHLKGHLARKGFQDIIGKSDSIEHIKHKAKTFAKSDSTVLILGETGTGKELFAQSIHNASSRRNEAFVAVNCAALPESLLESELFGYVKGAFTGALHKGKQGLFEMAHMGTIFLDEISEIPLNMQARLLRVLQEREVIRIGDDEVRTVNIRIMAASNKNVKELVKKGLFRKDLFYRLSVLELRIPLLQERADDIALIVQNLLWLKKTKLGLNIDHIEDGIIDRMKKMQWPGNIRQLDNFMEKLMILTDGNTILMETFNDLAKDEDSGISLPQEDEQIMTLKEMENRHIITTLERSHGNRVICAKLLGIDVSTLWRKLKTISNQ
ncbi:MAG: sigma 54-interacting transcriptional regulator [Treponema sp.]|nr:sigma 54-interacting transcriptional regulator [Treponema sp.]